MEAEVIPEYDLAWQQQVLAFALACIVIAILCLIALIILFTK